MTSVTVVVFHNLLGRLYFFFVKPFHKLLNPGQILGHARLARNHPLRVSSRCSLGAHHRRVDGFHGHRT